MPIMLLARLTRLCGESRRVVLRAHQPDMSGDAIDRATARLAQESGRETQGLELGPLGTLTLRAVKPWYDGDTLIGYLELGEEIDHVAQEIHAALGLDLLVLFIHRGDVPQVGLSLWLFVIHLGLFGLVGAWMVWGQREGSRE